jgi:FkbM family methyltransferase
MLRPRRRCFCATAALILPSMLLLGACDTAKPQPTNNKKTTRVAPPTKQTKAAPCAPCPRRRPLFPRLYKPVEFVVDFYGLKYAGNSGNLIDRRILFFGAFEKDVLHFMRDAAAALKVKRPVFIDVGANTGQHALFMSKHVGQVYAVEPLPSILVRLRKNVKLNGLKNVTVLPVGFGAKAAELPFYQPPKRNLGSGSFVRRFQPGNKPFGKLKVVRGDDALREAGAERVDLIKIDVEGYEKPVLQGLKRTLATHRPWVVMELTIDPRHAAVFKSADELRAAFPKDYRFFVMRRTLRRSVSGRYTLRPYDFDFKKLGQHELVVLPKDKLAALPRGR